MIRRRLPISALLVVTSVTAVQAQDQVSDRVSAETVAGVSMFSNWPQPSIILDGTATVRVSDHTVALVRPWVMQRSDGSWTAEWYQLQVRFEPSTRSPLRVDAGVIPSPLGLATLQLRPDLNPTVSPPLYYVMPLPRFDATFDALQAMSGGYPLGAIVSTSGPHWDARGGVTNASPALARAELKDNQPPGMPQLVLGGGVTPMPGLRFGGGFAHGRYRNQRSVPVETQSDYTGSTAAIVAPIRLPAAGATVTNVEAEYALGHTRVQGEWVWDRFETTTTPVTANAFFVQATHTFTPRWFGAGRLTSIDAPTPPAAVNDHTRASVVEANAGYRLTREFTLRGGYYGQHYFYNAPWDNRLCVSIVWARLWR
jgi:hypothetical protein